ncbi:MAG TPA: DsbA family oxidoreductase, partial [Pseudogracilibacillus sp.]|nr:DsbA family oxidoreductase [Pseudogracilibacillus sp.]
MNIELWSDFTCPYCYIGKRRLEMALEQLGIANEASIEFKSYQLDGDLVENKEMNILDHFKNKYNLRLDEVTEYVEEIERQAKEVNLIYNYTNMKQQSTFDAHRLVKYAYEKGKGEVMTERLLKAYFVEAAEISKHDVLLNLAKEIELDQEEVINLLRLN